MVGARLVQPGLIYTLLDKLEKVIAKLRQSKRWPWLEKAE